MNTIIFEDILKLRQHCTCLKELHNSTFLISGATGFVGSYLIHTLIVDAVHSSSCLKIYAVVRDEQKANSIFHDYIERGYLELIIQDIRQPLSLNQEVDYVIHCASNAAPREYISDPIGTILTNCIGTNNILDFAVKYKIKKVLYLSTIEVYGTLETSVPITEEQYGSINCTTIRSCYPLSKKVCENLCASYADQMQLPIIIGRLCYLYGPGMKINDSKVVAEFTRNIANNQNLILKSKGRQKRSYCYISDAISGLLTILVKGISGEAYNISSDTNITTVFNIAETLINCFPEKGLEILYESPDKLDEKRFSRIKDAVLDNSKLKSLGWKSNIGLQEGLIRTVYSLHAPEYKNIYLEDENYESYL